MPILETSIWPLKILLPVTQQARLNLKLNQPSYRLLHIQPAYAPLDETSIQVHTLTDHIHEIQQEDYSVQAEVQNARLLSEISSTLGVYRRAKTGLAALAEEEEEEREGARPDPELISSDLNELHDRIIEKGANKAHGRRVDIAWRHRFYELASFGE